MMFWLLVFGFVVLGIAYIDCNVKLAYAERRLREVRAELEASQRRVEVSINRAAAGPIMSPMGIDWAKYPKRRGTPVGV